MPLSANSLDYSLHHSRTHPNTMNTITNTKRIRACNRGIVASIRYKCRSHFIKQIYELAAIIDLGSRHLHQVETESELQLQNCYRGGGQSLVQSLVQRSADPICVALTTMSHVACGTIAGQLSGTVRWRRVITQSLIQMPSGHRRRNCSQVTHCFPYQMHLLPPLPPAPGAARTRTRSDVDACSCA